MSDDSDDAPETGGGRRKRRQRVTLKWNASPLSLPGEAPPAEEDDAAELALPSLDEDEADLRPSSIPPPGEGPGLDGWERQLPTVSGTQRRTRPPSATKMPAHEQPGDALSLIESRERPSQSGIDLRTEMHDRYALGDYTDALRFAELVLGRDPEDAEAKEVSEESKRRLAAMYLTRLGERRSVPHPVEIDVRWLGLDHRAAYLLSRIDGSTTLQALIDLAGMPELEVLRTCVELLEVGAITVD